MYFKEGVGLVLVLFFVGFASASFQIGNPSHSITTQYSPSEPISGWINISLNDEPSTSIFTDSNGNSVGLLEIISRNKDFDYSCNLDGCASDYSTQGSGSSVMNLSLNAGQKSALGITLEGDINYISSLNFTLNSNAGPACSSQVEVDLFSDGEIDFANERAGNFSCSSLNKGCFDASKSFGKYTIGQFPGKHCQKINLSSYPAFNIGAWIDNSGNDPRNITVALYTSDMEEVEGISCKLPTVVGTGEALCRINYSVKKPTPYFVCVYSDRAGSSKVKGYTDKVSGCGFYQESDSNPNENAAFDMFAQGIGFDSLGEMKISDSSEETMGKIKDYIERTYGSNDCSQGCILPFKIVSNKNQNIAFGELTLVYTTNLGRTESKEIYSLVETSPKISSNFQKILLDKSNLTVSKIYGENNFTLKLSNKVIFSEKVNIKNFPRINSISPMSASSLIPVTFKVSVNSSKNLTYFWNFNDNTSIQKSNSSQMSHTYKNSGIYKINISIQDSEGLNASKVFEVLIVVPKEQISAELDKKLLSLITVKAQIAQFDSFTQSSLNSVLEIDKMEKEIKNIQREYTFILKEEDYARIAENISAIETPESVAMTKISPFLPFYPSKESINLEVLRSVGGGTYTQGKENLYKDALLGWQVDNANVQASISEFSSLVKTEERPILTEFKIKVNKNDSGKPVYLFIKKMEDMQFKERYFEKESGDYVYWILDNGVKEIEFSTSEKISYETLPVFVSPEISELSVDSTGISPILVNLKARWGIISISLFILILAALIVYTMLSIWYKRQYESYLFKNRNDLYNLISYVNISKKKGEKEEEMKSSLKKAGWTGEQIAYVLKKYSGKRTGMIELPLTKLIDKFMTEKEKPKQNFQMRRPF